MGKVSFGPSIIYDDTAGAAISEIKYKSHVMPVYTAGATSLNLTIPSDTIEGDLLIVCMFARSLVTAPSGWTQIIKQSINTANMQWLIVYYKIAISTDAGTTLTFNQSTSGRMALSIIVATCPKSGAKIDNYVGNTSDTIAALPSIASQGSGRLCLLAHTTYYTASSGSSEYFIYNNKWIMINNPFSADNRLAISIAHIGSGTIPLANLTKNVNSSDSASVAVIFAPN